MLSHIIIKKSTVKLRMLKAYLLPATPARKALLNSYNSGRNVKARTDVNLEVAG